MDNPPYSPAILAQLAGALMRGKVDLAFRRWEAPSSSIGRLRIAVWTKTRTGRRNRDATHHAFSLFAELASNSPYPRNVFSAARSARPFAQSLKADSSE
jgi:hypothetical protein